MKKILITGSAGYIGSVVTSYLLSKKLIVVGVDDCRTGFLEPMETMAQMYGSNFKFYHAGISHRSLQKIFSENSDIDIVIHLAASSQVDESIKKPKLYKENNVEKSKVLFSEMQKVGVKKLIFASSAAVYGEAQYVPIDEKHPLNPANPYGKTKLIVEKMIQNQEKIGLNSIIFRFFNVCGTSRDELWGDSRQPSTALVQNVVRGALGISPFLISCTKVPTPDGTTIRDYLDVSDIAVACHLAIKRLEKQNNPVSEIFNLGSGEGKSIKEVVSQVDAILGSRTKLRQQSDARKGEVSAVYANIERARAVLGWKPKRKLPDSVKSLISWYKSKPAGWSY